MNTLTVSDEYQIVIPERMRETLGIKPGSRLHAIVYQGRITLVPVGSMQSARGLIKGIDAELVRESDRC